MPTELIQIDDAEELHRERCSLTVSLFLSPRTNRRNIEAPVYPAWWTSLEKVTSNFRSLIIAPQWVLDAPKPRPEDEEIEDEEDAQDGESEGEEEKEEEELEEEYRGT